MQRSAGDPAHSIPPYSLGPELANGEERQWVARETSTTGCGSCRHHWASFGMRVFATGGTGAIGQDTIPALVPAGHTVSALVCSQLNADMVRAQGAAAVQVSQFDRCGTAAAFAGYDAVATNVLLHRRQFRANPREHIFEYPLSTLSRARSMSEPGTDSPRAVFPPRYRLRPLGSRRSRGLGTNTCLTTSSSPGSGFVTRR
jgi:hypothetical protein